VVPQGFVVLFPVVLGGDFRSPLLVVILVCFRDLVLGDLMGKLCEPFVVLLPLIPLPNPQVKGLDFGVFGVLGLEVFSRVDFRFLLIEWVLGFPTVQAKTGLTGLALWAVEKGFPARKSLLRYGFFC
jgi:hypothetical protein